MLKKLNDHLQGGIDQTLFAVVRPPIYYVYIYAYSARHALCAYIHVYIIIMHEIKLIINIAYICKLRLLLIIILFNGGYIIDS